jgi:hypothetical protein
MLRFQIRLDFQVGTCTAYCPADSDSRGFESGDCEKYCKEVQQSYYRPEQAQSVDRGIALLFCDLGARRGCGVSIIPQPLYPLGTTWYPMYRRLGGPQGWSGCVQKISSPPAFDSRAVQPVASRYTDPLSWPMKSTVVLE